MSLASPSGQVDLEALDRDDRDQDHQQEQDDRDRRAEADLEPSDRRPVGEERQRLGAVRAVGHDEDVVEDPEGIECPEQHGDHDGGAHVGDDHPLIRSHQLGAVDLGGLSQLEERLAPGRTADGR